MNLRISSGWTRKFVYAAHRIAPPAQVGKGSPELRSAGGGRRTGCREVCLLSPWLQKLSCMLQLIATNAVVVKSKPSVDVRVPL